MSEIRAREALHRRNIRNVGDEGKKAAFATTFAAASTSMPSANASVAALLDKLSSRDPSVVWLDDSIPDSWIHPDHELPTAKPEYWRAAIDAAREREDEGYALQLAMAREALRRLLVQNKYLRDGLFAAWPSRDRHQLWATLWLATRFVHTRRYSTAELESELTRLLVTPEPSLVFSMQADLERRGLTERDADGIRLSRKRVDFLLDGDKLFTVRAAVAANKPWYGGGLSQRRFVSRRCLF